MNQRTWLTANLVMSLVATTAQGTTLTKLGLFDGTNGANPTYGLTVGPDGNLYGTAVNGGPGGYGTVFKIDPDSGAITTVVSFDGTNGARPSGPLLAGAGGYLYGTTTSGGTGGQGTLFKVAAATGSLQTLFNFSSPFAYYNYTSLTADASGDLYGVAGSSGFPPYHGIVFKLAIDTGTLSTVATLDGIAGGFSATGVAIDAAGNLYGTTDDGPFGYGSVFKITAGTNTVTTIASFHFDDGSKPRSKLLIDSAGNVYGTTWQGGNSDKAPDGFGTLFRIDAGTGILTTLVKFDLDTGVSPFGDLIADAAGNVYGTTNEGGPHGTDGTIYKFDPATSSFAVVAAFDSTVGSAPCSGLVADATGKLYGETIYGNDLRDTGLVYMLSGSGFVVPEPSLFGSLGLAVLLPLARVGRRRD